MSHNVRTCWVVVLVALCAVAAEQPKRAWGPEQATGAPDTMTAGDHQSAWAPLRPEMGMQWIELAYAKAVEPAQIRIHETFNPGAVAKVEVLSPDKTWQAVWEGRDSTTQCPAYFEVQTAAVKFPVSRVRIHLDTDRVNGWNEIDAVELVAASGERQWAESAQASSSYAEAARASGPAPRIVTTVPAFGGADVDPALKEITVTFDQDMASSFSWTGGGELFPRTTGRPSWRDKRTCALPVQLEAGRFYRVGINSGQRFSGFHSEGGRPTETWAIWFCTRGATPELVEKLKQPKIVATVPAIGDQEVDPNLTELRVTFDQEMGGGFSWTGGGELFPRSNDPAHWDETKRTAVRPVKLEPGRDYRLGINSFSFKNFSSANGVPVSPVIFNFRTRKAQ